ncbi:DUF397 domain-containing protein [Streptomyces alkaliphilus]|uniref:DUF397 domain-containing protein n=1 Tax=Streptomyces alkaliphilus TaxID=1472722 RepID=UPI0011804E09|nr:DUF397 domain-containing protein [Streptomyces alkaliphilus]
MNTVEGRWFKSTYSSAQGDDCVEVAFDEELVLVRDSKDTSRPHLAVRHRDWARLVGFAVRG